MNPMLEREIERMLRVFNQRGRPLSPAPLKSDAVFDEVQKRTGIALGDEVKDFYRRFGGRAATKALQGINPFTKAPITLPAKPAELFAVEIAGPTLLEFRSLPDALNAWVGTGPHEAPRYDHLELPARDPRIQQDVVTHPGWFPLAEVNGGSTLLYFDDAPNAHGRRGQIIVYQHDPDEVFYVADDFAEFLVTSNDLLERCWDELFF
jgi:cell wall assembly regulator SMI1